MKKHYVPRRRRRAHDMRRSGSVAVQVAVSLTTLIGFSALAVDVGVMYTARAELQRTADAAALAAAAELGGQAAGAAAQDAAREVATQFAELNKVAGSATELAVSDVVFGVAYIDPVTDKYVFTETQEFPNAVRVHVRRTSTSASGPVALYFASIFGVDHADVGARATAVLTPRDIAIVMDLSASHNDDSSLRSFKNIEIGNRDVWQNLKQTPTAQTDGLSFTSEVSVFDNGDGTSTVTVDVSTDGSGASGLGSIVFGLDAGAWGDAEASAGASGSYNAPTTGVDPETGVGGLIFTPDGAGMGDGGAPGSDSFTFTVGNEYLDSMTVGTSNGASVDTSVSHNLAPGPYMGNMREWGDEVTGPAWDFANDDGLVHIPRYSNSSLTNDFVSKMLMRNGYGQYTASELAAINSDDNDNSSSYYERRVLVALGIYRWKSGQSGGQSGGNGNSYIGSGELELMVPYPGSPSNPETDHKQVGGDWGEFVDYVEWSSSEMATYNPNNAYYGDSDLRYRYGLKTWVDYLQEEQKGSDDSPGMAGVPFQPMGAVSDAVQTALDLIEDLEGEDLVGLASYGTYGYGPASKPNEMSWLTDSFDVLRNKVDMLQPAMWTSNTNIAAGIDKGVEVLFESADARESAAKTILLLTDGIANSTRYSGSWNESQAIQDTKDAANDARDQGVRIYAISVGANADQELMGEVAEIGDGEHFHAEGSIDTYAAELESIFQKLGGKRPVVLIE